VLVGLISDTHGLLRDEALHALRGAKWIIHGGDVGAPSILAALKKIAPVVAVRGNVDSAQWAETLPLTAETQAGAARIYVLHNVNELQINPADHGISIVVSGHSHKPAQTERDGVLYINPGSAGPRRFRLPITLARLDLSQKPWKAEFIELPDRQE
jgi:putative phosphoesterase